MLKKTILSKCYKCAFKQLFLQFLITLFRPPLSLTYNSHIIHIIKIIVQYNLAELRSFFEKNEP